MPLVKHKYGDLSDINNYRSVAIATTISKVFETILLNRCENDLYTSNNQFGFKAGHSTDMCIHTLRNSIEEYFKTRNTSFYNFLDATKAFDRLNHWFLFWKRGVPLYIVKILAFWYSSQTMCVQWGNSLSAEFCYKRCTARWSTFPQVV